MALPCEGDLAIDPGPEVEAMGVILGARQDQFGEGHETGIDVDRAAVILSERQFPLDCATGMLVPREEPLFPEAVALAMADLSTTRIEDMVMVKKTANTEDDWVQDKNLGSVYLK